MSAYTGEASQPFMSDVNTHEFNSSYPPFVSNSVITFSLLVYSHLIPALHSVTLLDRKY